jgi:hypothetical protein
MRGDKAEWPVVASGKTEGTWPTCLNNDGSNVFCRLSRGHTGIHRSEGDLVWGDEDEVIEEYHLYRARVADIASQILNMFTRYIGQEGRGASRSTRDAVLRMFKDQLNIDPGKPPRESEI